MPLLRRNYYACKCGNNEFYERAIVQFGSGVTPRPVDRKNVPALHEVARYIYICTKCGEEQPI